MDPPRPPRLRLSQSSFLACFETQLTLAAVASVVAIAGMGISSASVPYRRPCEWVVAWVVPHARSRRYHPSFHPSPLPAQQYDFLTVGERDIFVGIYDAS